MLMRNRMQRDKPHINLRLKKKGRGFIEGPKLSGTESVNKQRYNILLIHGYNNSFEEAVESYEGFRKRQREIGKKPKKSIVAGGKLLEVFWPGEVDLWIFSALSYPAVADHPKTAAEKIADVLENDFVAGDFKFVDIIAHSLGCRVAVELMHILQNKSNVYVRKAVLMAAAVPTFRLDPSDDLRKALDSVKEGVLSLYSEDDKVLAWAFPPGQTLGGDGFFPTALGREFLVGDRVPDGLSQVRNRGADHSDYWVGEDSDHDKERFANEQVRKFLNLAGAGIRAMKDRNTWSRPIADSAWKFGRKEKPTEDRVTPHRDIGDRAGWY